MLNTQSPEPDRRADHSSDRSADHSSDHCAEISHDRSASLVFTLSGGLMVLGLVGLFGAQQGWFQRHLQVSVLAPSSMGLVPGTPVRLSGLRIGVLDRMTLQPDGQVSLVLRLPERYRAWVSPNSTAKISVNSLISPNYVELTPAPMDPALVPTSFKVAFVKVPRLEDLLIGAESTRRQLDRLLRSSQHIAERELPTTLQGLNGTTASSTALAQAAERELAPTTAELRRALRTIDQAGRSASRTSDAAQRNLDQLSPEFQAALRAWSRLMARGTAALFGLQGWLEPAAPPETPLPQTTSPQSTSPQITSPQTTSPQITSPVTVPQIQPQPPSR